VWAPASRPALQGHSGVVSPVVPRINFPVWACAIVVAPVTVIVLLRRVGEVCFTLGSCRHIVRSCDCSLIVITWRKVLVVKHATGRALVHTFVNRHKWIRLRQVHVDHRECKVRQEPEETRRQVESHQPFGFDSESFGREQREPTVPVNQPARADGDITCELLRRSWWRRCYACVQGHAGSGYARIHSNRHYNAQNLRGVPVSGSSPDPPSTSAPAPRKLYR